MDEMGSVEKDSVDEIEIMAERTSNEAKPDHSSTLDYYDPSLHISIARIKGIRTCTKHSVCHYVSYENLSPQFIAIIANLDSTMIPKNIHIALECPE